MLGHKRYLLWHCVDLEATAGRCGEIVNPATTNHGQGCHNNPWTSTQTIFSTAVCCVTSKQRDPSSPGQSLSSWEPHDCVWSTSVCANRMQHGDRKTAAGAVAYLGFPAPEGKLSLGAPTQPVCGSIVAKNELGVKGRRKLTWAPRIVGSRPVCKLHMMWRHRIDVRNSQSWKSLTIVELRI